MGLRQRVRAQLHRLPPGQRRFVIIGGAVLLAWFALGLVAQAVGWVRAATHPAAPAAVLVPQYPGATAENAQDDDGVFFTTRDYTARTRDAPATVRDYYRAQLIAAGWQATDAPGREYVRRDCPYGTFDLAALPASDGGTTIRAGLIVTGRIRALLPLCR